MPIGHLDSMYKNRWEEFHLANGSVKDSRLINWRNVVWNEVVKIVAYVHGHVHEVNCSDPRFRAFMNFRWFGMAAQHTEDKKYIGHKKINIWTIGWTDGVTCFQKNIDFKSGLLIDECESPIGKFAGHVHPAVRHLVFGGNKLWNLKQSMKSKK